MIDWLISIIPDSYLLYVYYSLIVLGVAGFIFCKFSNLLPVKYIPTIGIYQVVGEVISVIMILSGCWLLAGYNTEMAWRKKTELVQAEVVKAQQESKAANEKFEAEHKKKQRVLTHYYTRVKQQVKEVEKKIDSECVLDPQVITILNEAASNPGKVKTTKANP